MLYTFKTEVERLGGTCIYCNNPDSSTTESDTIEVHFSHTWESGTNELIIGSRYRNLRTSNIKFYIIFGTSYVKFYYQKGGTRLSTCITEAELLDIGLDRLNVFIIKFADKVYHIEYYSHHSFWSMPERILTKDGVFEGGASWNKLI